MKGGPTMLPKTLFDWVHKLHNDQRKADEQLTAQAIELEKQKQHLYGRQYFERNELLNRYALDCYELINAEGGTVTNIEFTRDHVFVFYVVGANPFQQCKIKGRTTT